MLHDSTFLQAHFEQAFPMAALVSGLDLAQQGPWYQRYEQLAISPSQQEILDSFTRKMKILSLTGPWCGDCALQGAAFARIADACRQRGCDGAHACHGRRDAILGNRPLGL